MTATEVLVPMGAQLGEQIERVLIGGDLAALKPDERVNYYRAVCNSVGLNPLTKPFEYINLNGKLRLYALRDATDQLRKIHGVSIAIVSREHIGDVYVVTARATDRAGRVDESTGAVTMGSLRGDALANALMKAETKAKRRVTLSICGLGILDETEIETIRTAQPLGMLDAGATNGAAVEAAGGADAINAIDVEVSKRSTKGQHDKLARHFRWLDWSDADVDRWLIDSYGASSLEALSREQADEGVAQLEREVEKLMPQKPATMAQIKKFNAAARERFPGPGGTVNETTMREWLHTHFQRRTTKFMDVDEMGRAIDALEKGDAPAGSANPNDRIPF